MKGIGMTDFYLGQIIWTSFTNVPQGLALCDGAMLPINSNRALFALLGTRYGGNGQTTFALPDLRGRAPLGQGRNPATGTAYALGQAAGEETVTLTQAQVPPHIHTVSGSSKAGSAGYAGNALSSAGASPPSGSVYDIFATPGAAMVPLAAGNVSDFGGGGAHDNLQPYLTLNAYIVTSGIFPPHQ